LPSATIRAAADGRRLLAAVGIYGAAPDGKRSAVIAVLATAGTLKADKYLLNRGRWAENVRIVEHVGKGFVELVESGDTCSESAEKTVRESLEPLLDEGADKIVLGCTHYPFLSRTIAKIAQELYPGREVEIIDPAPAVARHLVEVMEAEGLMKEEDLAYSISLLSSGDDSCLKETYKRLL
jgi:glutamate racemase